MTKKQNQPDKRRVIVDVKNVTQDILAMFADKYPYGYDDEDIVKFTKPNGETVTAVPFETEDTKYLIKIGTEMDRKIDAFLEDDDDGDSDSGSDEMPDGDVDLKDEDDD